MSISHLFDHTVDVWRVTEAASSTLRLATRTYTRVLEGVVRNARLWIRAETVRDDGGGETVLGSYKVYMDSDADVRQDDVLLFTAGPHAGLQLEVQQHYRPTSGTLEAHHTELACVSYRGTLP